MPDRAGPRRISLIDFEFEARSILDAEDFDYIAGGAGDERLMLRSRSTLDGLRLMPRRLVDLSAFDPRAEVLGTSNAFPVLIAPSGNHGIAHPDAELATVAAAGRVGITAVVSAGSTLPTTQIARAATGPLWYQTYLFRDKQLTVSALQQAEALGFRAICVTVDSLARPKRERDLRNGYTPPASPNIDPALAEAPSGVPSQAMVERLDWSAGWQDLEWLCGSTPLPIVVKGVLHPQDAIACADHGASAVIVSDHGGRQFDSSLTAIEALPAIAQALASRIDVLVDGGIREGADVVKALALGARAVLIGRPVLYGLAVAGAAGVVEVLEILRQEFETAMVACGIMNVDSIPPDLLVWGSPLDGRSQLGASA